MENSFEPLKVRSFTGVLSFLYEIDKIIHFGSKVDILEICSDCPKRLFFCLTPEMVEILPKTVLDLILSFIYLFLAPVVLKHFCTI